MASVTVHPEGVFVPEAGVTSGDVEAIEVALQRTAGVDSDRVRVFIGDRADASVPEGRVGVRAEIESRGIATALQAADVDVDAAAVRSGMTNVTADRIVETFNSRVQTLSEERDRDNEADRPAIDPDEIGIGHEQDEDRRIVRISRPRPVLDSIDDAIITDRGGAVEVLARVPTDT